MTPLTVSEKILSARSGRIARAGDIVVSHVDWAVGTDGSGPMAIDYFERMGATSLFDPTRVFFSLDHYSPPNTAATRAFHDRIRDFASRHGATVFGDAEGISHQVVVERGIAGAGDVLVGADSHAVTCGALNCFAIGVGSSDLAAAMMTGRLWLRVPRTIRITLSGERPADISAKDVALALIAEIGADGANYQAIEFDGDALAAFPFEDRLVLSSLMVECGAKAAIFPHDAVTAAYRLERGGDKGTPVTADAGAEVAREVICDLGALTPRLARPDAPTNVGPLAGAAGVPVQMVFIGTCTGGRVSDVHAALTAFEDAGGRLARGVQLVITPASREVHERLVADGTMAHFMAAGAVVTTPGCGACCGTSGVLPADGMTVLSTANRNFKARMGNATARIYLASPAACGRAAATGRIA
jgi:3-isopropylmalate/(R)-2-methylmalate dehydratase large subunit